MEWHNEPASWSAQDGIITITSDAQTDFWRKTHDGGQRDSGHLYGEPASGDFTAEIKVTGQYNALYDHAGLMIRHDESHWIKCGIEYVNGVQYASAVVTRDTSDWSVSPLNAPPSLWLRVKRSQGTVEVHVSLDGAQYTLLRQTWFPEDPVIVGPMIAAPKGDGFSARFEGWNLSS
jgi:regulation of enolase protein 1 (concanavalin A-like superfamily)